MSAPAPVDDVSPGLVRRLYANGGKEVIKYSLVSVVAVVVSQIVLLTLIKGVGTDAVVANMWAVAIGAIPAYIGNRAWVWRKTGSHDLMREIVPFWAMSFLGLALSTLAVDWAVDHYHHIDTALVALVANFVSFGALWVAKFLILHFVMFGGAHGDAEVADSAA